MLLFPRKFFANFYFYLCNLKANEKIQFKVSISRLLISTLFFFLTISLNISKPISINSKKLKMLMPKNEI